MYTKQAVHISHSSSSLLDFFMIKVPKFNPSAPVFYLDSHSSTTSKILSLLPSTVSVNDLTPEVDNIACLTNLERFEEGERVFLEEDEGEMAFDPDLQRNLIGYVSFVDPRTRFLGSRIIAISDCIEADDMKDMDFYRM